MTGTNDRPSTPATGGDDTPQNLADTALAASTADGCVVVVEEVSAVNVRFAANAMTTNGHLGDRTMTVISVHDHSSGRRVGMCSGSAATSREVTELVRRADAAGRDCDPLDDAADLVEPDTPADNWDAPAVPTGPAALEPLAPVLGAAFDRGRREDRLLFGFAEQRSTSTFLTTSTGLRRRFDQPVGRFELTGVAARTGHSAWYGTHAAHVAGGDALAALDAVCNSPAARVDREVSLPAGRYETILPPSAVADLMICAYRHASARDAHQGRNVYAAPGGGDRIGEELSPLPLTLYSDPREPGLRCAPFDIAVAGESATQSVLDNGQPAPATMWIRRGRLHELVRTRAWAHRTGAQPRPFIGNLVLDGGGATSLEQMIATTRRGLLLTSLWYVRDVDPHALLVTGLTRDGVYLVENGRVVATVNNFRFNESPIDLLRRVTEVGRTEHTLARERGDSFPRTAMPPLRIADFAMSAVSTAR